MHGRHGLFCLTCTDIFSCGVGEAVQSVCEGSPSAAVRTVCRCSVHLKPLFLFVCLHQLNIFHLPLTCPHEHSACSGRFLVMPPSARAVATDVEVSEKKTGEKRNIMRGVVIYPFPFGAVHRIILTSSSPSFVTIEFHLYRLDHSPVLRRLTYLPSLRYTHSHPPYSMPCSYETYSYL
jgi:hypothetical protein